MILSSLSKLGRKESICYQNENNKLGFVFKKLEMKNNSNSLRNFEVKQKLGSGSYGVIFKAINKTDKSVCVLKQINLARMSERAKKNVQMSDY